MAESEKADTLMELSTGGNLDVIRRAVLANCTLPVGNVPLYQAFAEAKKKSGEKTPSSLDAFSKFVQKKTGEIRKQYGCQAVEYSVEVEGGHVKLKAKAKE